MRGRRSRRTAALAVTAVAASCAPVASRQQATPGRTAAFRQYDVSTGSAERQTVLTGFLLGGRVAELAVVNVGDDDRRRLRVYAFADSTWTPGLDVTLRPGVRFVDIANIGGRDRLVTYGPGRLDWFDPGRGTERSLV